MADQIWDWQRLWVPASNQRNLSRATLLPDNIEAMNPSYRTLSQLSDRRLLILLGEPGTGKTTELRQARDEQLNRTAPHQMLWLDGTAIGSDYRLDTEWFESTLFKNWLAGDHNLWIFFDGYDQVSARVTGLRSVIENRIASAPLDRLYLRISARTAEWNYPLGANLSSLFFGPNSTAPDVSSSFILAPPKRSNIMTALSSEGLDSVKFMEQLDHVQIGPITLRPVGLGWLMNIFRRRGHFPESADELYWEGMRILSQEPADSQPIQGGSTLSAEDVRHIAARIAFVTAFANRDSVWTGLLGGGPDSSVPISDMVGGAESHHGLSTSVTDSVLQQSLRRGIFSGMAANSVGWAHQTIREFLAAKFCVERRLSTEQILGLLTNPSDSEGKIIPNLREVAAWLTSMREDVLEQLIDRDPQTLFDSDVALTGPAQRERLLKALVQGVNSGSVVITRWHAKDEFRKLFFPGIEEPLRMFLTDRNLQEQARRIVVDIIRDCKIDVLAEQLAMIALDRTEPELLRVGAAWGVRDLDSEKASKTIKPLIRAAETESSLAPESIDDLRGCALASNWRNHLGIEELLQALTKPSWDGLGDYKMFLSDFAQQLEVRELPQAFEWLASQKDWGEQHWELETIEQQLLEKAWANLEDRDALKCFAQHAVQNLSRSRSIFGQHVSPDVVSERVSDQMRRRLALGTILSTLDEATTGPELVRLLRYTGLESLIVTEDFLWYLDQIRLSVDHETAREIWVRVAFQRYDPENVEHTQMLWDVREEGVGGPLLAGAFEAVALDSEEANQERLHREALYSDKDPDPIDDTQSFSTQSRIVQFLKDIEEGKTGAWWHLDFWLQVDGSGMHRGGVDEWETDIRLFPGWALCDEEIQRDIVNGANAYLRTNHPNSEWFGTLNCWRPDLAGFRAFVLLREEAPASFENIPDSVWREWGPLFLAFPPRNNSDEFPFQRLLLTQSVDRGFETIDTLRLIAEREGGESTYIFSSALKAACAVSDETGSAVLAEEFINARWNPTIVQEAVRVLVEVHKDSNATRLAVPVAQEFAKDKSTCAAGAQVAGHVLTNRADLYWDDFWPMILESKKFRYGILIFMLWHDRRD